MNKINQLEDLYTDLVGTRPIYLFVTPLIRYSYKKSDYLYLFYKKLLSSPKFTLYDVSTVGHLKFLMYRLFNKDLIVHYHWLQFSGFLSGFTYCFKVICLYLYIKMGGKLIWSIHNKLPPDTKNEWVHYKVRKWLAKQADVLVVECETAISEVSAYFNVNAKKFRVWPHPSYPPQLMPRAAAIESINQRYQVDIKIRDRLFLMFGHISAYKQIGQVCRIFADESIHKKLLIVGPVKKGQLKYYKKIRREIRKHANIILIPQFISEDVVPEFMNAADYVVFNYREILTSGGVPLARSYDKTIILPQKGCLTEYKGENLLFFKTREELEKIIREI